MAERRQFKSKVQQNIQKIVIVGIDFGTSFTKVYFSDGAKTEPIEFDKYSYFLPTKLYYQLKSNKLFFNETFDTEKIEYFKYSMINDSLSINENMSKNNKSLTVKSEFLCSIYFLAYLIKIIKNKIFDKLKTNDIKFTFNMGCPIDNYRDKNKDVYDEVLNISYQLSDFVEDSMKLEDLYSFYNLHKNTFSSNLLTVPELYAEALWFIEQPSISDGLYTVFDVGGGTIDFATLYIRRSFSGEKRTTIFSQKVMPLGVEILLQYMYPNDYKINREKYLECLKTEKVNLYDKEEKKKTDRKIKKADDFYVEFSEGIAEVKERNRSAVDEQYQKIKYLPYYSFGGGADFNWYHSIINSTAYAFERANIPKLKRQPVNLSKIPHDRLIIAEQLTRSSFPEIDGFPWNFEREKIFSGINRKFDYESSYTANLDYQFELEDRQRELYGD